MEIVHTDGKHPDYVALNIYLEEFFNELYPNRNPNNAQLNKLDTISDVFLLYDGSQPIGCAGFRKYSETSAEVKRVFVKKEYRGIKLSQRLMDCVENTAKEKGYQYLILETGEEMKAAMKLYTSRGYEIIPNYGAYKNSSKSICMSKKL